MTTTTMTTTTKSNHSFSRKLAAMAASAVVASGLLAYSATPAHAADFTVTNTNDSGAGSLRKTITDANASPGADIIKFNIPGSGVKVIEPLSPLPDITGTVTIDGYSQPGSSPNTLSTGTNAAPKVMLAGQGVVGGGNAGLQVNASNSVIKGLIINRFDSDAAIEINNASGVKVEGNFIGTGSDGSLDLGNTDDGVQVISNSSNNVIGGSTPAQRNLISGQDGDGAGVLLMSQGANRVQGNLIGTKKDGTSALANAGGGVLIYQNGATVSQNTIAFNGRDGVTVHSANNANRISQNSIFSNNQEGIDLNFDGKSANDQGDADANANGTQNFPVLSSAKKGDGGKALVKGSLNSLPNKTFSVEFFSNPSAGDEGKKFLGKQNVTTNGSGNVSFSFLGSQVVSSGETVTATATDSAGNTSEFSVPKTVA